MLKYMDNITCEICLSSIKDDIIGVSCCHSLFHGACLDANREYSIVCPKCEEMYQINRDNPLLVKLTRATTTHSDIDKIYTAIYRNSPDDLNKIDKALRLQGSKMKYHEKFRGYFPYYAFNDKFNMGQFREGWEAFTYGLLNAYDWQCTVACGHAVWDIAKHAEQANTESDDIYLVIYNRDYRKVRTQLKQLLTTVETEVGADNVYIYIEDSILVINIRGMVRKICVYIEYNDTPFWIIYSPRTYFNTYGSLYTGTEVYMIVKAIINDQTCNYPILSSLGSVMGYDESKEQYSKQIGCGMENSQFLLRDIYPEFRFRVSERYGIDNLKKSVIYRITQDISDIVDIEHCINPNATTDIAMELVTSSGSVTIPTTIITTKYIRKQVSKVVYQQPLHLYPRQV
jgi:hypothetical protein